MSAVEEHKAKILDQLSLALNALATVAECGDELDSLLYAVRYTDELAPLHSDAVDTAYDMLGASIDQVSALRVALAELMDEVS